jgi:hypothetical protein
MRRSKVVMYGGNGNISQKVFRLAPPAELADHVNYRSEREKNYG